MISARIRGTALVAIAAVLSVALGACARDINDEPGSIVVGGVKRTYVEHVPAKLGSSVPLLLSFHGHFGTGAGQARLTNFSALSDKYGFVVVYPDGIDRSWNDGRGGADDIGLVKALIADFSRRYPIDPKRIYMPAEGAAGCHPARPIPVLEIAEERKVQRTAAVCRVRADRAERRYQHHAYHLHFMRHERRALQSLVADTRGPAGDSTLRKASSDLRARNSTQVKRSSSSFSRLELFCWTLLRSRLPGRRRAHGLRDVRTRVEQIARRCHDGRRGLGPARDPAAHARRLLTQRFLRARLFCCALLFRRALLFD